MITKHRLKRKMGQSIRFLFFMIVFILFISKDVSAKTNKLQPPELFSASAKSSTSLKLEWSKCKNVDGYIIYRYQAKKYVKVKQITSKNRTSWIDKGLKKGKVYKYKITSYKKERKKIKQSKKSYEISAMPHGKSALKVNANRVSFFADDEVGICSDLYISSSIHGERTKKTLDPEIVSDKLLWSSSDETIAKVDQTGKVTATAKEGSCYIMARAHSGVIGIKKINVVNYARPKSFPDYSGGVEAVDLMLTEYRENVFNIATYFTIYGSDDVWGTITMDEKENLVGLPRLDNISSIEPDLKRIIGTFPLVTQVEYSGRDICIFMRYDKYGSNYCRIDYYAEEPNLHALDMAPHWYYMRHIPYGNSFH